MEREINYAYPTKMNHSQLNINDKKNFVHEVNGELINTGCFVLKKTN